MYFKYKHLEKYLSWKQDYSIEITEIHRVQQKCLNLKYLKTNVHQPI